MTLHCDDVFPHMHTRAARTKNGCAIRRTRSCEHEVSPAARLSRTVAISLSGATNGRAIAATSGAAGATERLVDASWSHCPLWTVSESPAPDHQNLPPILPVLSIVEPCGYADPLPASTVAAPLPGTFRTGLTRRPASAVPDLKPALWGACAKVRFDSRLPRCRDDPRGLPGGNAGPCAFPNSYTDVIGVCIGVCVCVCESSIGRIHADRAGEAKFTIKCDYSERNLRSGLSRWG